MKTCVLIPAHNEAKTIGPLVEALVKKQFPVIVIDDGSGDNSGDIAREKKAMVLCNEEKMGKGNSLKRGFEYILRQNYDNVILMDGDGQHDVDDTDQFIERAYNHPRSIICGTRMQNYAGMPPLRLWTNRFMSALISAVCKQKIPDTQCGFRLIPTALLKEIRLTSSDFEIETEVLIKASKKGYQVSSVPIKTIYRNEVSKINPLKDTIRFIVYIIKEMFS